MCHLPWFLWLHTCFLQMTVMVIRPTSAYRALELGIDAMWLGLIVAAFSILPLFLATLAGRFADAGHERAALVMGAGLMLVAAIGLLWSASLTSLLLWSALLGVGHVLAGVGQQTLVARADPSTVDTNFGRYTFAGSIGQMLGPLMITVFGGQASLPDTTLLFAASAGCAGVATVFAVASALRERGRHQIRVSTGRVSSHQLLTAPRKTLRQIFGAIGVSVVILAVLDVLTVYLPAWGVETGNTASTVGILLSVRALATMLSRLGLGALVRAFGRPNLILGSTVLAAAMILVLIFSTNVVMAGAALFIVGAALGIIQPLTMAVISVAAPTGTVGLWLSIRLSGNSLGLVVIPSIAGIVGGLAGVTGVFGVLVLALTGVAGASWALRNSRER